jgi:RHS repeat-associated protein
LADWKRCKVRLTLFPLLFPLFPDPFSTSGATTDTFAFDAFGNLVSRTGSTTNEMLYRGEQFEAGLESYYLRARYFVPKTGRFLTMDKHEGTLDEPMSLHGYVYGHADPVKYSDPSGKAVVIGTSLITHATSSGSAITGVYASVVSMCGLAPLLSHVRAAASNFTYSGRSLADYPITSPCNPFWVPPGKTMKAPGDCVWQEFGDLNNRVKASCHANNNFGETGCDKSDDKPRCASRAIALGMCLENRIIREATCFRGGNMGHRLSVAILIGKLSGCYARWAVAP